MSNKNKEIIEILKNKAQKPARTLTVDDIKKVSGAGFGKIYKGCGNCR